MPSQPESKRPWFKFFPTDWQADSSLRICSLAARGLWIELLALMHQSEPYGHLLIRGNPPNDDQLARLTASTPASIRTCMNELEHAGVFSRDQNGVIFSRRMVRDYLVSEEGRKFGSMGGNPKLGKTPKAKDNRKVNPPHNPTVKRGVNPPVIPKDTQGVKPDDNPTLLGEDIPPDKGMDNPHAHASDARGQSPEAINHIPESEEDEIISPEAARAKPVVEIISLFDDCIAEVYGENMRRPWPHGDDSAHAREFLKAGADIELCRQVFLKHLHVFKRKDKHPISSLAYFRTAIPDAVKDRAYYHNHQTQEITHDPASHHHPPREPRPRSGHDAFTEALVEVVSERK